MQIAQYIQQRLEHDVRVYMLCPVALDTAIRQLEHDIRMWQGLELTLQSPKLDGVGGHTNDKTSPQENFYCNQSERVSRLKDELDYLTTIRRVRHTVLCDTSTEEADTVMDMINGATVDDIADDKHRGRTTIYRHRDKMENAIKEGVLMAYGIR